MKRIFLPFIVVIISLLSFVSYSQNENDLPLLGLPGDNLDLYAVLDLFQKSKTIEDFEKSLNEQSTSVNNLDLNNDDLVDFIKVITQKDGDDYLFILQDAINENETQDVAVISVSKNQNGDVFMQIIGDETLYGKDYIISPNTESATVTANPGYTGSTPVTTTTTKTIVVQSAPIVQYVYSPAYVPYYPPYYYGYYPPYWAAYTVMAIGMYHHYNYHHHGYYGHNNNIYINNTQINHYNKSRNTSNTVNTNIKNGNFNTAGKASTRPASTQVGNRSGNVSTRPATSQSGRATATTRPATSQTGRATNKGTTSTRPATTQSRISKGNSSNSRPSSNYGSRSRSSYAAPTRTSSSGAMRGRSRF
jgi:hypothetical protein